MWVADKSVYLDSIRLDDGYIDIPIQWYEKITGIYGSDMFYRLYCDSPPQVQIHAQLVHGNISVTQIYGTEERHSSTRNTNPSPLELLHGYDL